MSQKSSLRAKKRWEILSAVIKQKEISAVPKCESMRQFQTFGLITSRLTGTLRSLNSTLH
jgi:hypothetical protein